MKIKVTTNARCNKGNGSNFTYDFFAIEIDTGRTFMFHTNQFQSLDDVISEIKKRPPCFIKPKEKMKSQFLNSRTLKAADGITPGSFVSLMFSNRV